MRNGTNRFGLISKLLHWGMAVFLIAMLIFGTVLADMKPSLANLYLFGLHKSLGITVLALVMLRIGWTLFSRPPPPLGAEQSKTQARLARATHLGLYAVMIAMPLTGWIASSAAIFEIRFFDLFAIPSIAPTDAELEKRIFALHGILGTFFVALIGLHVAGALVRQFVKKDRTLARMWF